MSLKMKALQSFETSGTLWPTTKHYKPEDLKLQQQCCKNVKSLKISFSVHEKWKVKLFLLVLWRNVGGADKWLALFLTLALYESEWSFWHFSCFTLGKKSPGIHWIRSLGAPRAGLNVLKKIKISYHCRNCTLDNATLRLVHVPIEIYELPSLHVYGTNFKWW